MRTIVLPITADTTKADGKIKTFVSAAAKELAKLNSGGGNSVSNSRSFGLAESQLSGYRKLAEQLGGLRERFQTAEKASSAFGSTFKGSFLGNAASNLLQNLTGQIEALGGKILGLGKTYADAGTAIYLASQKTALSAEALSVVKTAADLSGSSIQEFAAGFTKFERTLATGGGKVKNTFTQLGIDISRGAKDPEAAFGQFLEKFRQLPDDANRSAVAMQLFGKAGANQIPTFLKLAESGKSFAEIKQEAVEMGLAFDSVGAKKAKDLEDAFTGIDKAGKGLIYSLAGGFAGPLTDALKSVTAFTKTLRPAFVDAGKYFGDAITYISDVVKNQLAPAASSVFGYLKTAAIAISGYFSNLSPETQKFIGIFSGVAAVVGTVVAAIAGISAAVGSSAILGTLAGAATAAAGALADLAIPLTVAAAAAAALYLAWKTNFGGIRDFTRQAWEAVKSATGTALTFISGETTKIGGQVVSWWNDNYTLIQETVKTVSDFIKNNIQGFLSAVQSYWNDHGAAITATAKTIWNGISGIISTTIDLIGGALKLGMQVINGDWTGALETVSRGTGRELGIIEDIFTSLGESIKGLIFKLGVWLADNWERILLANIAIIGNGIESIVNAFENLPAKIVELAPKFKAAGYAIWEAIRKGFSGGMQAQSLASANVGMFSNKGGIGLLNGGQTGAGLAETANKINGTGGGIDLSGGGSSRFSKAKKDLNELKKVIDQAASDPQVKAFFAALSTIEGGGRFTVVGGKQANINDPRHPGAYGMGMQGPAGWSTAAGFWQETQSNWKRLKETLNLTDFRDVNQQLKVALYLFQEAAGKKGINGIAELMNGNLKKAAVGTQPWAASPFSTLPGGKRKDFLSLVEKNLGQGFSFGNVTDEVKSVQEIVDLRARINQLVNDGGDANQKQLDVLRDYESNLGDIQKMVEQINNSGTNQQLVIGLPDSPEDAAKLVERLKALTDLQKTVETGNDAAKEKIFELSQQMSDGLTDLEKFDYGLQQLRASGKLTASDFALLADNIDDYRQNLKQIQQTETAQKLAAEAKAVSSSLSEMTDDFRRSLSDLTDSDQIKPFTGFLDQIRQLKDLDLPTDAFSDFKSAISPDGVDVTKLAEIARFWLELSAAIGGTDASKIDEIISKITQSATAFNQLNDAQKSAKNAADYKSITDSLDSEYSDLLRNGREYTAYEKTLQDLNTTYKDLSDAEKQNLLQKAQQIDAQRQFNEQYEKTYDFIRNSLDILTDSGKSFGDKMRDIFGGIANSFKQMVLDMTSRWLTSKLFGGGNGAGNGSSGGSGGLFGNIFGSSSPGGNSSGGLFGGSQGNGIFNLAGGGSNAFAGAGAGFDAADAAAFSHDNAKGGFLDSFKSLFAPKGNILTGGTSKLGGTLSGIGAIASTIGSFLPGKLGSVVSMAGTGLSIGANFGPWGAAIGAGIGGLLGLFGGDPKRKADKQQLPQFNQGITDALQQLRDLASNRNSILSDPGGAIAKAQELRASIANSFGYSWQSSKYKKQAEATIQSKLAEADTIIKQIQEFSNKAQSAKDLEGHIIGEFATGGYMDGAFHKQFQNFKRLNGYLTGGVPGKDSIPAYLMPREIVINEAQQERIRRIAGVDAFAYAGIPNYPKAPVKMANGGFIGNTFTAPAAPPTAQSASNANQLPTLVLNFEHSIDAQGLIHTQLTNSDQIKKDVKVIVNDGFYNSEMKTKSRNG